MFSEKEQKIFSINSCWDAHIRMHEQVEKVFNVYKQRTILFLDEDDECM